MQIRTSKIFEVHQFADDFSTLPIWKLSCYAPGRGLPVQLCDGTDLSVEEFRMNCYQSGGNFNQANAFMQKLEQEAAWRYEYLKQHPTEAADYINMVHQSGYSKYTGSGPSPQTFFDLVRNRTEHGARVVSVSGSNHIGAGSAAPLQSPRSAFGLPSQPTSASASTSVFGSPGSSAFGPPTQASGAFGNPNRGAFGIPSAGALGVPSSGAFYTPNSAVFGAPTTGAFGVPITGAFGTPNNGAFSTPPSGAFGGQSAFGVPGGETPSAFGSPYTRSIQPSNDDGMVRISSLASAFVKPQDDTTASSSTEYPAATPAGHQSGTNVLPFGTPQPFSYPPRPAFSSPSASQGNFTGQGQSAFAISGMVPRSMPLTLASAFSPSSSGMAASPSSGQLSNTVGSASSNQISLVSQKSGLNSGLEQLLPGRRNEFFDATRLETPVDVEFVLRIQGAYTQDELEAFRSDAFQAGRVPTRAPTQAICENRA